jgi:hypothetical protein
VLAQWLSAVLRSAADDMDLGEFLNIPEGGSLERLVWGDPEIRSDDSSSGGVTSKEYVKYHLECFGTAGQHWKVNKRFSDFCSLRDALISKESASPAATITAGRASATAETVKLPVGPTVAVECVKMVSVATRSDPDTSEQYTAFGITIFPRATASPDVEGFVTYVQRQCNDTSPLLLCFPPPPPPAGAGGGARCLTRWFVLWCGYAVVRIGSSIDATVTSSSSEPSS